MTHSDGPSNLLDHSSRMNNAIEAWIDVGGTFSDCFVRTSDGVVRRTKLLSSGVVPVSPVVLDSGHVLIPELAGDADDFWVGARLVGFDIEGSVVFDQPIDRPLSSFISSFTLHPSIFLRFEVRTGLEAPVLAVHRLLQVPISRRLPPAVVRIGTTRGTNALLTRSGAKIALIVTAPFEDLLAIGDQTRPDLFALNIVKRPELAALTLSVDERLAADGSVLRPMNIASARKQLQKALDAGCQSLAISLMHSYRRPDHELMLEQLARELGFEHISRSSSVAPVIEYVARTQTTVVDAYLSPIIRSYLRHIYEQLGGDEHVRLSIMTSAGGLVDWREYSGKDSILSGPAGGVIALSGLRSMYVGEPAVVDMSGVESQLSADAANAVPRDLVTPYLLGLDMGGTSTDVCLVGERVELQYESSKAGVRILTPTMPIETVAAGGGSICWFDGVSLRVGPQSAGASPGPACYGQGGPLTITDINLFSGRIPPSQFPFPLDQHAIASRLDELLEQVLAIDEGWTYQRLVEGFRRLANQHMSEAVRTVSIKQGVDPRDHVLVGFGGAAGQHICEIAEGLGIGRILDHPDAGLLSALGMGLAKPRLDDVIPVYQELSEVNWSTLFTSIEQTEERIRKKLAEQFTIETDRCSTELNVELRYTGTDATLTVPLDINKVDGLTGNFSTIHQQRFGYHRPDRALELVAVRVMVCVSGGLMLPGSRRCDDATVRTKFSFEGDLRNEIAYRTVARQDLKPGAHFDGPALVLNFGSTLTVENGWSAEVMTDGSLWLEHGVVPSSNVDAIEDVAAVTKTAGKRQSIPHRLGDGGYQFDPVLRDCFAQRLSAIATQMGDVLQQTAVSVNVKQRRDFSCGVFDSQGRMLANAPHVPVHLGAMGQTVRAVLAKFPDMVRGDLFLCNDPYEGGSHLPDLTMVAPVFGPGDDSPSLFVANRAHHADIGGISPGSMSVEATRLEQEGIVIPPMRLRLHGEPTGADKFSVDLRLSADASKTVSRDLVTPYGSSSSMEYGLAPLRQLATEAPYPPRNWSENEADLAAQQAACSRGIELLQVYAASIGWPTVHAYAEHLLEAGHQRIRQVIESKLRVRHDDAGSYSLSSDLEDGTVIHVTLNAAEDGKLNIDFTGTGPVSRANFNANPSIVMAAVLYVLRCMANDDLPLNEGVMRAVELVIPTSVLNPPGSNPRGHSPAVAAGNVETSQRVADVLLGALGLAAASQGTMNNVLFGNSSFGFYETICGGVGATETAHGASAVHTHMTNTRLTDPEVLETRYPVRLVDFRIREGSGGNGGHTGGDGVIRGFEFLQPVTVSLITSRRAQGPFGLQGGESGMVGENRLVVPGGETRILPACCQIEVQPGGRLIIATPGGGGFGEPAQSVD